MRIEMNSVNIALDFFCICICLLLCFYLTNKRKTNIMSRSLFYTCFFNILFILGDLTDWCCNGLDKIWYPAALHVGQFLYYLAIIPLVLCLLYYIYYYLSSYKKLSKWYLKIPHGIGFFHLIGSLLTPLTGWYYTITDDNIYMRGKFVLVSSLIPIATYLIVFLMTFECRKQLNTRQIVSLLSYAWMPIIGQIIQNLFRGVGTLIPSITLCILLVFINIQLDSEIQEEKGKQALSEAKMQIMLSQIQPHFLYNTLTIIRHLCDVNPSAAKESINHFSLFLRANMDSLSTTTPIPFEQELIHVKSYLSLEQQRFGDMLMVEYDIQTTDFLLPALSVQPIAENAIRHGIRKNENGGTLCISTSEDDSFYYITITDDGIGFNADYQSSESHIGIKNVRKRLKLLCNASLSYKELMPPLHGTIATISIPKEKNI